jgi:hypothetical protein
MSSHSESQPRSDIGEKFSTPLDGHIFVRYDVIPASGEVSYSIANDKRDGLGVPGRCGMICNGSNSNYLRFQISPDGDKFSNEIILPGFGVGFPNHLQISFDDGVLIHTVRLLGTTGEPYGVVIAPGRLPEGFIPSFTPIAELPGSQRKIGRNGLR